MTKRAVLVGCNYPGTESELQGCVNDVTNMREVLVKMYGFQRQNIVFMIDTDERSIQPTGRNVAREFKKAIQASKDGDVLYFHFSGHGGQIPAESGDVEDDGYDECIFPTDLNPMTDDSFRLLLANLKPGVHFTFVSDSCNSGGLLDSQELQVGIGDDGEVGDETESTREIAGQEVAAKNKMIPTETLVKNLSEKSSHAVTTGNIRATIYELYGEDASPSVKVFVKNIVTRFQETSEEEWTAKYGYVGTRALASVKRIWEDDTINNDEYFASAYEVRGPLNMSGHANAKPSSGQTLSPYTAVLVSGSQSNQTSADVAGPNGAYGALSNAIETLLKKHKARISNKLLVNEVRKMIAKNRLTQRPCLYCSEDKVDKNFITSD